MLHKSSLFPTRGYHCPIVGDVKLYKGGLIVYFMYSKTVQFKQRRPFIVLPLCTEPDKRLCPVLALVRAWKVASVKLIKDPLLPVGSGGTVVALSGTLFVNMLKLYMSRLGLYGYTGHSFRRGGACHALFSGVPAEMIMAQGDWRSLAYLDYLNIDDVMACDIHMKKMLILK